jgi:hypothetical protein
MILLQTNSYIVPKDKRTQHARLVQRFRQSLARLGCDHFEAYEQVGANWSPADTTGRFVQLMRFRDRKHQLAVQAAERNDPTAQALIKEFCELINFPYQQQQGLFAVGFYHSLLPTFTPRLPAGAEAPEAEEQAEEDHLPAEAEQAVGSFAIAPPHASPADAAPLSLSVGEMEDELGDAPAAEVYQPEAGDVDVDPETEALLDEIESGDEPAASHTAPNDTIKE